MDFVSLNKMSGTLFYLEEAAPVSIQLGRGSYNVEWINPINPKDRRSGDTIVEGNDLIPPKGGDDWLLYLTRTENGS